MKRTVTVVLLAAALVAPGSAARADDPTCAAGEEWQGEFGCVAVQRPEERIGGARCPDGADVIQPDGSCGPAVVEVPASEPIATPTGPVASEPPTTRPAAPTKESVGTAPAAVSGTPFWVLLDRLVEMLRTLIPSVFGR